MPNTKFNKQTLEEIKSRKAEKIEELREWTRKSISDETKKLNDLTQKDYDDEISRLDREYEAKKANLLSRAKGIYKQHVRDEDYRLYSENEAQKEKTTQEIAKASADYSVKVGDEGTRYQEKEKNIKSMISELSNTKKQIEDDLKENKEKIDKIEEKYRKTNEIMAEQVVGYNQLSSDQQNKRDAKLKSLQEDLEEINQTREALFKAEDEINAKLKDVNTEIDGQYSVLKAAPGEYFANLDALRVEKDDIINKLEAQLVEDQSKREDERKALDEIEYQPHVLAGLGATLDNEISDSKKKALEVRNKKFESNEKEAKAKLEEASNKIVNRLEDSVDIEFELRRIVSLPKKMGHTNTEEFEKMTAAVKESYLALGEINTSKETERNILSKCVAAYKECQNYIAKKDRKSGFLEWFRSDFGKKRLLFASDMMVKLKEVCPGLEDALKEENVHEAEKKVPNDKGPKRDVKGELDALKKEYQKNNKNQNVKNVEKEPKKENVNRL